MSAGWFGDLGSTIHGPNIAAQTSYHNDARFGQIVALQFAMDAFRQCAYRENMVRFAVRTISLIAAYALALHALLFAMIPPAVFAAAASMTPAVICTSGGNLDQPAGQDRAPCAPDCTMPG